MDQIKTNFTTITTTSLPVAGKMESNLQILVYNHSRHTPAMHFIFAWKSAWIVILYFALIMTGYGKYPTPLSSRQDVEQAPADTEMVYLPFLPVQEYPLLSKFEQLWQIHFFDEGGKGADDQRLEALSRLKLPNLKDISLLNCPMVTDQGISALTAIKSLKDLQLEGTSITDISIPVLSSKMQLDGLDIANCKWITFKGLSELAASDRFHSLEFSADGLTQAQLLELVDSFKPNLTHVEIVDQNGQLNVNKLKEVARVHGTQLVVRKEGALQTMMAP